MRTPPPTEGEAAMKQALWNVVSNVRIMVLCIVISQVIAIVRALA